MPTPHSRLSHPPQVPAGAKTPQPHSLEGTAVCGPTDSHPQAPYIARSAPMLPLVVKGEPPLTHLQDLGPMKPPMPNSGEEILQ